MAAHGYLAYLVRVSPPHRTRNLQRLSAMGVPAKDLLIELRAELRTLGATFYKNPSKAEGFRLHSSDNHGRSTFIRLRRGPVGNPGETFDVDSGASSETGDNTALLSELRAAFFVPEDSYFGFLFVERNGGRHLKDLIYQRIIVPIAKRNTMIIRVEAFAETDDWKKELAGQQVLRVTEVLRKTDSAQDDSTVDDTIVKISAEGLGLTRMSQDIKDLLFNLLDRRRSRYLIEAGIAPLGARKKVLSTVKKRDGSTVERMKDAPKSVFTVADAQELDALVAELERVKSGTGTAHDLRDQLEAALPVDRDGLESRRLEVGLGEERAEKTFVLETDSVPQLVYELQKRLLDIELQRTWEAHAERFLASLGVSVPAGWLLNRK